MEDKTIYKFIMFFSFLCWFAVPAASKTCLDCKVIYEIFERKELKKYFHLELHTNVSFKVIDANYYFPNYCFGRVENRDVIISRQASNKKVRDAPLPLVFEIVSVKEKNKKTTINFQYDYEGVVGEVTLNKKGEIKKIVVWER